MNRRTFLGAIAALAVPMPAVVELSSSVPLAVGCRGHIIANIACITGGFAPIGASIGWSCGSAIGQMLEPPAS